MKISEVIAKLQEQQKVLGDAEVFVSTFNVEEDEVYLTISEVKYNETCNGVTICGY